MYREHGLVKAGMPLSGIIISLNPAKSVLFVHRQRCRGTHHQLTQAIPNCLQLLALTTQHLLLLATTPLAPTPNLLHLLLLTQMDLLLPALQLVCPLLLLREYGLHRLHHHSDNLTGNVSSASDS